MQKIVDLPNGRLLMVKVPKTSKDHWVMPVLYKDITCMLWFNDHYGHDGMCEKMLPPGSWQLLGKLEGITEEQANGIVQHKSWREVSYTPGVGYQTSGRGHAYKNYLSDTGLQYTAKESLQSLITSNGFNPDETVLLFEPSSIK